MKILETKISWKSSPKNVEAVPPNKSEKLGKN